MDRASSGPRGRPGRACAVRLLHVTDESTPSPDPTATDAAGTQSPKSADDSSAQPKQPKADPGPGEQFEVRAGKRERLRGEGWDPYPVSVPVTTTIAAVREGYAHLEAGQETDDVVGVAGRVVFLRNTGRLCFVTLQDGAGTTLQAMLSAKALPAEGHTALAAFKADVDLGDHLFVHGRVISSRRGELSVMAEPVLREGAEAASAGDDDVEVPAWWIASKALRPLPKTWTNEAGEAVTLSEEQRVRRRELDLLTRPAARDMVRTRAAVVRSIRENFFRRDYLELETPMLQVIHGGAAARPFITHMNAFDMDLYLRIATEIYLKRAVVGGVDRVFEINRNFRNEGADSSHSPEFTALEAYEAYSDYDGMAELTRDLVQQAARDAFDRPLVPREDRARLVQEARENAERFRAWRASRTSARASRAATSEWPAGGQAAPDDGQEGASADVPKPAAVRERLAAGGHAAAEAVRSLRERPSASDEVRRTTGWERQAVNGAEIEHHAREEGILSIVEFPSKEDEPS